MGRAQNLPNFPAGGKLGMMARAACALTPRRAGCYIAARNFEGFPPPRRTLRLAAELRRTSYYAPMPATDACTALCIDPERLARDLAGLARIGIGDDGSVNRLAFSLADLRGRHYMIHLLQRAGISVRMDGIGNLIGRIEGRDAPGLPGDPSSPRGRYEGTLRARESFRSVGASSSWGVSFLEFVVLDIPI